jgi:hypothetical protein
MSCLKRLNCLDLLRLKEEEIKQKQTHIIAQILQSSEFDPVDVFCAMYCDFVREEAITDEVIEKLCLLSANKNNARLTKLTSNKAKMKTKNIILLQNFLEK